MAGNGFPPKADSERRNKSALAFEWVLLPASGRKGPAPKLPNRTPKGKAWSASTKSWWSKLWKRPQATQWSADDDAIFRLAWLREKVWLDEATAAELSEMRQIEDRLGLSPKALLQLRWRIVADELLEVEKPKPAAARRERLRIVS